MKILITRRERLDVPDGINIFIFSLADSFTKMGHEVFVLSTYESSTENIAKYYGSFMFKDLYSLMKGTDRFPARLSEVLKVWLTEGRNLIRKLKPDFCIFNGAVPFMPRDIPHVFVSHDLEFRFVRPQLQTLVKKLAYYSAVSIVATTSEIKEGLMNQLGIPSERLTVIPTCIKVSQYQGKPLKQRSCAILHIGTAFYKNPETTIHAFKRIESLEAELLITGEPSAQLLDMIEKVQDPVKRKKIRLLGRVSDAELKRLLGEVRVVSVPSVYRTPVASPTVLESLASGTPVVTTTSISRDIAVDGFNCFIRSANSEEFASALEQLLLDDSLWEMLSKNARLSIKEFDADRVAERYLELYETRIGTEKLKFHKKSIWKRLTF